MAKKWIHRNFKRKVNNILSNVDLYHKIFYKLEIFSGPSLYFHHRALSEQENWTKKAELIYAALASWGMHRMGAKGSKMLCFDDFCESITTVQPDIAELRSKKPRDLSPDDWSAIEKVFKGIKVMASGTTIVGNSKVMAHILPNLIAPIDREYTFYYLFGKKGFQNDLEREWQLMNKILSDFYYPIASNRTFLKQAKAWMAKRNEFPWDTSILKIIDNLVIGAVRKKKK